MLDIGIAVAIALLLSVTAYLGTHLTMHPAETPREKFWYKTGFAVCGLVGCALIGVQTWRNSQTQDDLRGRLSRIEKNTKTPPSVQVTNTVLPAPVVFPPTPVSPKIASSPNAKPSGKVASPATLSSVPRSVTVKGGPRSATLTMDILNSGESAATYRSYLGIYIHYGFKFDAVRELIPYACERADRPDREAGQIREAGSGASVKSVSIQGGWDTHPELHPMPFMEGERPDVLVACISYKGDGETLYHLALIGRVSYAGDDWKADEAKFAYVTGGEVLWSTPWIK